MGGDLLKKAAEKEALVILIDSLGNVIWGLDKNPVATMCGQYFEHQFSRVKVMALYANQADIAVGIMAGRIPIRECHRVKVLEGGLEMFREMGVTVIYAEFTPLAKSSKDDMKVCPIEQFLYDHRDQGEQRKFFEERFKKN